MYQEGSNLLNMLYFLGILRYVIYTPHAFLLL